jgi:hypothetical protein
MCGSLRVRAPQHREYRAREESYNALHGATLSSSSSATTPGPDTLPDELDEPAGTPPRSASPTPMPTSTSVAAASMPTAAAAAAAAAAPWPPRPTASFAAQTLADLKWSDIPALLAEYQGMAAVLDALYAAHDGGA